MSEAPFCRYAGDLYAALGGKNGSRTEQLDIINYYSTGTATTFFQTGGGKRRVGSGIEERPTEALPRAKGPAAV